MVNSVRMVSYVGHSCANVTKGRLFEFQVRDHVVHLEAAPPIIVDAWSVAVTLWQQSKYYYYCKMAFINHSCHISFVHKIK